MLIPTRFLEIRGDASLTPYNPAIRSIVNLHEHNMLLPRVDEFSQKHDILREHDGISSTNTSQPGLSKGAIAAIVRSL